MQFLDKALKCFNFPGAMIEAFKLALDSKPFPNPKVGAVLTDKHLNIKSSGFHKGPGKPHAEIEVLNNVHVEKDDILFVTLEPCFHSDTSPSCADEIIKKGVKNIYYGGVDIDSRTNGKSIDKLQQNSISIKLIEGVNQLLNPHYLNQKTKNLKITYTGKLAISNDNFIYSVNNKYISNEESLLLTHVMRANYNSILIGKNTYLVDNPLLDTRLIKNKLNNLDPIKFVLWGSDKNIINFLREDFIFLTEFKIDGYKNVINLGTLNFENINNFFTEINNFSVLIEGGNSVHKLFIENDYYDNFYLFKSQDNLIHGLKATDSINILNGENFSNKELSLNDNILNIYTRY